MFDRTPPEISLHRLAQKKVIMKSHRTKEQCFAASKLPEIHRHAFYSGWYAAGIEINEGEDYDWFQERLYQEDFLPKDEQC